MKQLYSIAFFICCSLKASSQNIELNEHLFRNLHFGGTVNALVKKGDTVFIGWEGLKSYKKLHGIAGFDNSKQRINDLPRFEFSGINFPIINTVIADDDSGYFIGGAFDKVNYEKRIAVTRINSNGSLHPFKIKDSTTINSSFSNVSSLVLTGDTLLVGTQTSMSNAGISIGSFFNFDAATGTNDLTVPTVNGEVYTTVPDGNGGFYIGGKFTSAGDSIRLNLAHISNTGEVTSWNPCPNKPVHKILLYNNTIFIAGEFSSIGGSERTFIAQVDKTSGNATNWNANINRTSTLNTGIRCLEQYSNTLFIAGDFDKVGSSVRNGIAQINLADGTATSWSTSTSGYVSDLIIYNNAIIVSGTLPNYAVVKSFDQQTGVEKWSISGPNAVVFKLLEANNLLFVAGRFESIAGLPRINFATFDIATGVINQSFNPAITHPYTGSSLPIRAMAINGTTLYLGGEGVQFVNGQARKGLAAISITTGNTLPFNPIGGSTPASHVRNLFYSNGRILVGLSGNVIYAREEGNGLFAFNKNTGENVNWKPQVNGGITKIIKHGSTIYIAGSFTSVFGQSRNGLAAFDSKSLQLLPWNPNIQLGIVRDLLIHNAKVYIGGSFGSVNGVARVGLAAIDSVTGNLLSWNPVLTGANREINCLKLANSVLYIGGWFTAVGGITRNNLAGFNVATGTLTNFFVDMDGYGITDIEYKYNSLVVSGSFTTIGNAMKYALAEIDINTGIPTNWDIGGIEYPFSTPNIKLFVDSSRLILFGSVLERTKSAAGLAAYHLKKQELIDFPEALINSTIPVSSLTIDNNRLYIAGSFNTIAGLPRSNFAALDLNNFTITNLVANTNSRLLTVSVQNNNLFIGGYFTSVNNTARNYLAAIDKNSGALLSYNPSPNQVVRKILPNGNTIYVAGDFSQIGGQSRLGVAATNLSNGTALSQVYNSSFCSELVLKSDTLIVNSQSGNFTGTSYGLYAFNALTGAKLNWNPSNESSVSLGPNTITLPSVNCILPNPFRNSIFTGSYLLDKIGGLTSGGLAEVSLISGKAIPNNININMYGSGYQIKTMLLANNILIGAGHFEKVNTSSTGNIVAFNIASCSQQTPVVTASGNTTICSGTKVVLSSSTNVNSTYQWYRNNELITGATNATYEANDWGKYFVQVSNSNNCISYSNSVLVNVYPIPSAPSVTQSGTLLTSSYKAGNQWYLNGNPIQFATDMSYNANTPGIYTVKVNRLGCISEYSTPISVLTTNVVNRSLENKIKVYPNPTSDFIYIQVEGNNKNLEVEIYNLQGVLLLKRKANAGLNKINIHHFNSGNFLITVSNMSTNERSKIMITKL